MVNDNVSAVSVELPYAPLEHLAQVYAGFQELERQGVVTLRWTAPENAREADDLARMILHVRVDGEVVVYDVNDGVNAYGPDRAENLRRFRASGLQGHYFKRSLHRDVVDTAPPGCTVHALGVNYFVKPSYVPAVQGELSTATRAALAADRAKGLVRGALARVPSAMRVLGVDSKSQTAEVFEAGPALRGPHRVMLFTRLWDPDGPDAGNATFAAERAEINAARIELLELLRERLGDRFTGGLSADPYAKAHAPEHLLLPPSMTQKDAYLAQVRRHSVCLATRGLHQSTGWRFGEYVAASRAIVTERLVYDGGPALVPGRNFLEFDDPHEAADLVAELVDDHRAVTSMMVANRLAYDRAIRPDAMILRSLLLAKGYPDPAAGPLWSA